MQLGRFGLYVYRIDHSEYMAEHHYTLDINSNCCLPDASVNSPAVTVLDSSYVDPNGEFEPAISSTSDRGLLKLERASEAWRSLNLGTGEGLSYA